MVPKRRGGPSSSSPASSWKHGPWEDGGVADAISTHGERFGDGTHAGAEAVSALVAHSALNARHGRGGLEGALGRRDGRVDRAVELNRGRKHCQSRGVESNEVNWYGCNF